MQKLVIRYAGSPSASTLEAIETAVGFKSEKSEFIHPAINGQIVSKVEVVFLVPDAAAAKELVLPLGVEVV